MKKMNLTKKAILPALLAVICSVVALTSVSYAWFSLGEKATIETIDVNVVAADSIQISADGATFKGHLSLDELKATNLGNQFPAAEIYPMSSAGTLTDGKLDLFKGEVDKSDSTMITTTKQAEGHTETNFIAFNMYVKLDEAHMFQLAGDAVVALKDSATSTSNIHKAVRVAFIYNEQVVIWEPYGAAETNTYLGVSGASSTAFSTLTDNEYTAEVTSKTHTQNQSSENNAIDLFDLPAGDSMIRVYVWVEGQDADCVNDNAGGSFKVDLAFCLADATQSAEEDE